MRIGRVQRGTVALAAAVLLGLGGCASGGMGGEAGMAGEYDLVLQGNGGQYRGWTRIDGPHRGAFGVTSPVTVEETAWAIAVEGGGYSFTGEYEVLENGCTGEIRLEGRRVDGGYTGSGVLDDGCVGEIPVQFTMTPR